MAIYVRPEMMLSCTLGQLNKETINENSVDYDDLEYFCKLYKDELRGHVTEGDRVYVGFDFPSGDTTYYDDHWRHYFVYFRERYYFRNHFSYNDMDWKNKDMTTKFWIHILKKNMSEEGISEQDSDNIINNSISSYLEYHENKYNPLTNKQKKKVMIDNN